MPTTTQTVSARGRVTNRGATFKYVTLRIHKIECVKTTKELDRDEIVLAAVKAEGKIVEQQRKQKLAGKAEKGKIVNAGKFKKGGTRNYRSPEVIARFKAGGSRREWPRYYVAALLMIEKDEGAIGTIVNSAVKSVEKEVTAALSTAASGAVLMAAGAGAAAGSVVPLVGTAIGAAAATATTLAFGAIKRARADDVFNPKHVQLRLPKFPGRAGMIDGSKKTVIYKGFKGRYKVTYSWAVS